MTSRERDIVLYINEYWQNNWTSPTVREIGMHLGIASPATVHYHLRRLTERGVLQSRKLSSRRVLYRVYYR
jgi:repressor LexA